MNWYKIAQSNNMLYHATYKVFLNNIKKQGLTAPVYLAQDYYQAEAFAEEPVTTTGEEKNIPEELYVLSEKTPWLALGMNQT